MAKGLFWLALGFLLSSCATTYEVGGNPASISSRQTASVEARPGYSGDAAIRSAITGELRQRGFRLTESRRKTNDHVAVVYGDTWRWDFVTYILRMEMEFIDPQTGAIIADAEYRNSAAHGYAGAETIVRNLFAELDRQGFKNR
ncbi:hypothetical protein [Haloferula sp.]|uniref:hypothetical protein n=1 Tax=Haloferula sp. TaxID=2497595 RepID=UPI003C793306